MAPGLGVSETDRRAASKLRWHRGCCGSIDPPRRWHFESNYVVSRLGGHIVRNFIANFVFIENAMVDTFISDQTVWTELKALTARIYAERNTIPKLKLRKQRAQVFYEYMTQ